MEEFKIKVVGSWKERKESGEIERRRKEKDDWRNYLQPKKYQRGLPNLNWRGSEFIYNKDKN
jgi:hypothetical protein